jgi:hypothetical protein
MFGAIESSAEPAAPAAGFDPTSRHLEADIPVVYEPEADTWPDPHARLIMTRNLNSFLHRGHR